jgi:hypothetical protein
MSIRARYWLSVSQAGECGIVDGDDASGSARALQSNFCPTLLTVRGKNESNCHYRPEVDIGWNRGNGRFAESMT